ncbi:hypothetical protein [Comamonas testosteroni]|jgi:hypothetical protein|uniref:hypothetical protein n=1 Tax=Comamonas testosteroni TaxID=285 RepID=UPI0026EC355A|nr:hypothetical protein [Comamonas testosteroni]
MKKITTLAAIVATSIALFGASTASAQTVYGQVGTTGVTLGYAQHFDKFNLRGDVNFFNYSHNLNTSGINYDAKLKFSNVGLFADYYPISAVSQFRVTGGFFVGNDKITARGHAGADSDIPDGEWATGRIKSKSFRPYIGVGWGYGNQSKGLSFTADLGASYGKFRTDYEVSPGLQDYWGDDRVQQERRDLDNKIGDYKWYPVIRVGLAYRFN